ncbi:MAG: hypothetical protein EOM55_02650 [Clostridia bacterium]|nr:hypothetical protein [Clostridia bacterium]
MQKSEHKKLMFLFLIAFFMISFFSVNFAFSPSFVVAEQTSSNTTSQGELASEYFLYNTSLINFPNNSTGLTANVENQLQSDLCWAFSSITALETTLYTTGLVNKSVPLNFSELDLAYNVFVTSRGWDSLGGGAFEVAYEYFSSDNGPVNEQSWETSGMSAINAWSSASNEQLANFYGAGLTSNERVISGFSALESYYFPSRNSIEFYDNANGIADSVTEAKILANRNSIKNHIKTYGAVTASMYFNNTYIANYIYYYYGNTTQTSSNHMVTLVGWDDNVTINGHTGAYIAQNSYGETFGNGGFFYISYDDRFVEDNVCGFTRMGENLTDYIEYDNMSGSGYQNQFVTFDSSHSVYYTSYYSYSNTAYLANIYQIDSNFENQYISRIKVPTMCVVKNINDNSYKNYDTTNFRVYILNGLTSNSQISIKNNFSNKVALKNSFATSGDEYLFSANQTGYYTVEVEEDIRLNGDFFAVVIEVDDGILYYMANNPNQNISYVTYLSQQPSTSWTIYGASTENTTSECVIPMKIQTKYDLSDMTYEVTGGTYTYDGLLHNPSVSVITPSTFDVTYSLDGINYSSTLPNIKNVKIVSGNVSSYTVYIKITADFYSTVLEQVEIRINPKSLLITPNAVTGVYGESYVLPMWALSGLVSGESVNSSGVLSVQNFSSSGLNNVGEYSIIQNNLTLINKNNFLVSNYAISFVSGVKYTVTPKTLYVVADELTKHYGDPDPALTYHFSGTEGTQSPNVSATLIRESGENVGEYAISLFGDIIKSDDAESGFYKDNYEVIFAQETKFFEIIPRILIITPNTGHSKIYEEDDPTLTFTISNSISGETPAFSGSLSRISGEDAGNYQITLGSLEPVDNSPFLKENYTLEIYSNIVYFTIYSGTITDSFVTDISDSYNGELHFLSPNFGEEDEEEYTVRYCEVSSKSDAFNEGTSSNENIGKINCGEYYICFEFLKENYAPKYETAKITISPIQLSVTPNAEQSKIYGESESFSFVYSGQISNEVPAFSGSLSRQTGENVGEYFFLIGTLVLVDNENFLANNYTLVLDSDNEITFEITRKTLTVIPNDNQSKLYGKNDPVLTFSTLGFVFSDTADFTGLLSRESGENIGEYVISIGTLALASSLSNNYDFILDSTEHIFEINPVGVKIKIINLKDEYGILLKNYYGEITFDTVSYEFEDGTEVNFVTGDSLELTYLCYEDEDRLISNTTRAGNYQITAESQNENYRVTVSEGSSYTISYRNYVVTFIIEENSITRTKTVTHFDQVGTLPDGIDATPTKVGYTFNNWKKSIDDENWTTVENILSEIIEENTKFKANMALNSYRIYYNLNGGSISGTTAQTSYTILTQTFSLITPTRVGYDFMGYYENSDFSGTQITQITQGSTGIKNLFAKWQIKTFSVALPSQSTSYALNADSTFIDYGNDYTFEINLSSAYNKSYATMKVCVVWQTGGNEVEITPQQIATDDEDGIKNRYTISNVTDDFELTVFDVVVNTYTINFVADGILVETVSLTHGENLLFENFPEIPVKEFFDETDPVWNVTINITNATQDRTILACYTPNVYTITFIMEDGNEFQVQISYGTVVDTSVLEDEYKLNMFEYFVFAKSLDGISADEDIRVTIASNINIFYTVVTIIVCLILLSVAVSIVRKRNRHQARLSAYNKINNEEYRARLEKYKNEFESPNKDDENNKK